MDNSDGHPVWVEGQNGQDTDRNINNGMKKEPKNYDEESINNGARTLKTALDSCIHVFESTVDWETRVYDLNPMRIESNDTIVGTVVDSRPQHPALLQAFNTRVVERTDKSPVKRRKSNRERPFNPVMRTRVQPPRHHPDLKKQLTTEELIGRMPEVPTHEIGNDKRDCKQNNSKKRPIAEMVNYQMNLKF